MYVFYSYVYFVECLRKYRSETKLRNKPESSEFVYVKFLLKQIQLPDFASPVGRGQDWGMFLKFVTTF